MVEAETEELCELYTDNDVPVAANFYNRFRTGEIPIGIDNASQYLLFSYAAPEIAGNWEIAPVPGHVNSDGSINRTNSGTAVDGCIILQNAANKAEAWKFLSWWTSAETQGTFSELVEGRIGAQARWLSANMKAFSALPWSKSDRVAINSAFDNVRETPVVLGSYFANRHLVNAINRTVIQGQSARDSLEEAVEQINLELTRRQKGYYKRQEKAAQKGEK
jgi:ABC-type glycerol-3-phosphate transport system substrate-binding protein